MTIKAFYLKLVKNIDMNIEMIGANVEIIERDMKEIRNQYIEMVIREIEEIHKL